MARGLQRLLHTRSAGQTLGISVRHSVPRLLPTGVLRESPTATGNAEQAPQSGDPAHWKAAHNATGAIDELRRTLRSEKRQRSATPRRRPHSTVRLLPAHLAEPERAERAQRIRVNTTTHWGSETTCHHLVLEHGLELRVPAEGRKKGSERCLRRCYHTGTPKSFQSGGRKQLKGGRHSQRGWS